KRPQGIKKQEAVRKSTRLYYNTHKSFTNPSRPLENGVEGKKNKKLDISLLESESSLLLSDYRSRLQAALLR
ncbi:hypothetical protein MMC14_010573, partial [Varicellaria rhodocarpa]|nr:hypothetical protein [Varicellaria rhodocarpa]